MKEGITCQALGKGIGITKTEKTTQRNMCYVGEHTLGDWEGVSTHTGWGEGMR